MLQRLTSYAPMHEMRRRGDENWNWELFFSGPGYTPGFFLNSLFLSLPSFLSTYYLLRVVQVSIQWKHENSRGGERGTGGGERQVGMVGKQVRRAGRKGNDTQ